MTTTEVRYAKIQMFHPVRLRGDWRAVDGHVNISNDQTFLAGAALVRSCLQEK